MACVRDLCVEGGEASETANSLKPQNPGRHRSGIPSCDTQSTATPPCPEALPRSAHSSDGPPRQSPRRAHQASCRRCPRVSPSLDPGHPSRWAKCLTTGNQHLRRATIELVRGSPRLRTSGHPLPALAIHHWALAFGPCALLTSFDARSCTCLLASELLTPGPMPPASTIVARTHQLRSATRVAD